MHLKSGIIDPLNYIIRGPVPRIAAFVTNTFEDHPTGEDPEVLPNRVRYVQVIVLIVMKIKYFPAGNTVQVVVVGHVGVKAFGTAVDLHQIHHTDFSES